MTKKTHFSALLLLIFSSLLIFPQLANGIAMVTEPIVLTNIKKDSQVTNTLLLMNSENTSVIYKFQTLGKISSWTQFYAVSDKEFINPITEISIPARSKIEAIARFSIPKEERNGTYQGKIVIEQAALGKKQEGISSTVALTISRDVSITITDEEIIKFQATIVPVKYTVSSGKPLQFNVLYYNQGNVGIKPDIQLQIIYSSTGKNIGSPIVFPYPEAEAAVMPFGQKRLANVLEWSTTGLENGNYIANMKVLLDKKVISEKNIEFIIGNEGPNQFLAKILSFIGPQLTLLWYVVSGILLIMVGLIVAFAKTRKKKPIS